MLTLELADSAGLRWAQISVTRFHYLYRPVDTRCSVLAYLVVRGGERVGCLMFGRPEATRCFSGGLTYGGQADVASGRASLDRWCVINAAGFERVRVNERGIETWARPLRGLQGHERQRIERLAEQSARSRRYRAGRVVGEQQLSFGEHI